MFRTINEGRQARLVIVSGWAFDWRPFADLSLPLDSVVYTGNSLDTFGTELHRWLRLQDRKSISLLGWSMGAYAAADFAVNHPAVVDQLILVAARRRYPPEEIEPVRTYLRQRRKAFLVKFYRDCFSAGEGDVYQWFRTTLLQDYLEQMTEGRLNRGLDWLSEAGLDSDHLQGCSDLVLVQGTADRIAPLKEAQKLAQALPHARTVWLKDAGHLPFLRKEFAEQVYGKTRCG